MRKLATLQTVDKITPIDGADRIVVAQILGWQAIIQKDEFKVGDTVIYCEVDSILPERKEFEFLRKCCYSSKWKGFRIRTIKLRGIISQGIVFSTDILPNKKKLIIDTDVTKLLDIRKWEKIAPATKEQPPKRLWKRIKWEIKKLFRKNTTKQQRLFPQELISKTDEPRVQNLTKKLPNYKDVLMYTTEKVEGQSATYGIIGSKFYVCSRNRHLIKQNTSNWWDIAIVYNIKERLLEIKKLLDINIVIQGEIIGPGIQGNLYELNTKQLRIFNIYDRDQKTYISPVTQTKLWIKCLELLQIEAVPLLDTNVKYKTVEEWIEYSKGISKINSKKLREGVVIRSVTHSPTNAIGNMFSFKAINPEYLLKYDN